MAEPKLIDISPTISGDIDVWPGDVPFRLQKSATFESGANLDLGAIETTLHVGAHTDAPLHYVAGGADVASVPLQPYFGPCQVIDVDAERGQRFGMDALRQEVEAPRVLLCTGTFPDPMRWNTDFAAPEPALIDALADAGVVLVGFDTPSTDPFDSKGLPSHRRLAEHGMVNLEGLVLAHVDAGTYTLAAFPLRIAGADASPVRAVLMP